MVTCPKCNKELEDGTRFCENCGEQIIETIFCQNCGKQTSTEFAFCQNCGASLSEEAIAPEAGEKKKFALPKLPFKLSKKLLAIGGACLALVVVAVIVLSILFGGGSNQNYALYVKDHELYFTNISKIDPWQVTNRLVDDKSIENSDLASMSYTLGSYTQLSKDGKLIFFVDKCSQTSNGFSLFCRYVDKPEKEPIKIDSEVKQYFVSESGKLITYLKGTDGVLYQHDLEDKEKIASDVTDFIVTKDGKKIAYLDKEGGMYLKYAKKDKEKIDSDVSSIHYINKDLDTVYYTKEDSLYKKVEGKDKEKIDSEVTRVLGVYESGEIYYVKTETSEINLSDYVEDDLKDSDAAMTQPEYPSYPSYWDYDDNAAYQAAVDQYNQAYTEYQNARDAWYEKQNRDSLRESLAERKLEKTTCSLYYYDGKEDKVLTDAFAVSEYGGYNYVSAEDSPVMIFSMYNQSSAKKVKLSEITSAYEVEDMVKTALYASTEKNIAIKDNVSAIDQSEAEDFDITSDGKTVYFLDDISEESGHGDLYKMTISGNKAQKPERYDSDVYTAYLMDNDKLVYYKDVKDSKGELYIDKQKIDYDVRLYNFTYIDENDSVLYMVDWNNEKSYGTLKLWKDGKATKIADDVHAYSTTPKGEILYLYDYSLTSNKGELFLYKGKKAQKIDDDVVTIVPVYDWDYRSDMYGW